MQGKSSGLGISRRGRSGHRNEPPLSPWTNEEFPRWSDLLTTHDVARLTRRHVWLISALALIGRFPKRTRFHGRGIGWNRHDVHDWMARRRRCISTRDLPRHVGAVQPGNFGSRHSPGNGR
jgi:predicted DNA-binding transcriptional regulator AlpA